MSGGGVKLMEDELIGAEEADRCIYTDAECAERFMECHANTVVGSFLHWCRVRCRTSRRSFTNTEMVTFVQRERTRAKVKGKHRFESVGIDEAEVNGAELMRSVEITIDSGAATSV